MTATDRRRHLLIVGATGLVGRAALEHFGAGNGRRVTTLSRRPMDRSPGSHLAVDLRDPHATFGSIGRRARRPGEQAVRLLGHPFGALLAVWIIRGAQTADA